MTGRDALLGTFDRLFDAAAAKLGISCTPEERAHAKADFAARFEQPLTLAARIEVPGIPADSVAAMESTIAEIAPAELASVLATIPLAQQAQEMLRSFALRQAEQRLIEHLAMQADSAYGGN